MISIVTNYIYFPDKDYRGALKILENPKKPYPQKRQVMRNSFGDYREKMAKEEAKLSLDVKVAPVAPKKETLIFLKKKASSASKEKAPSSEFKFNFSNDN